MLLNSNQKSFYQGCVKKSSTVNNICHMLRFGLEHPSQGYSALWAVTRLADHKQAQPDIQMAETERLNQSTIKNGNTDYSSPLQRRLQ
jgi:hypothetical protein